MRDLSAGTTKIGGSLGLRAFEPYTAPIQGFPMRAFIVAAFLLSGFITPLFAYSEEVKLDGTWVITVHDRGRQRAYDLEVKQDGEKVSGTFISPRSGSYAIKEGSFAKGGLKLVIPRDFGDVVRVFEVEARLGKDGSFTGTLPVDGNEGGGVVSITGQPEEVMRVLFKGKGCRTHYDYLV